MGMRARLARRLLNIPMVVSFYGIDMSYFPRLPEYAAELKLLFADADMVLALGERMRQRLEALGCPAQKIRIQHVGADLKRFAFRPRSLQPGEPVRFLFCGRFVEKKGVPYLLRAFAKVRAEVPNVQLTLIGDGVMRPEIEHLVGQLDLASSTRLLGMQPQDRVTEEMERTHLLVGPSVTAQNGDDEGGVLTCGLEGSAAGLPLIATRHADIPEQLVDGVNGLMVEERDVDGLAAAMTTLARAPERWPALGAAGRALIEERFDIEKETQTLEGHYAELLAMRRPPERTA
jgi:colanic acid/amylovoran biosynthesis glycosyltransferase